MYNGELCIDKNNGWSKEGFLNIWYGQIPVFKGPKEQISEIPYGNPGSVYGRTV